MHPGRVGVRLVAHPLGIGVACGPRARCVQRGRRLLPAVRGGRRARRHDAGDDRRLDRLDRAAHLRRRAARDKAVRAPEATPRATPKPSPNRSPKPSPSRAPATGVGEMQVRWRANLHLPLSCGRFWSGRSQAGRKAGRRPGARRSQGGRRAGAGGGHRLGG
ncbi:hypothetical protein ACFPRL_17925 [Pseudoclavibacter helvolus]